MKIAVFAGSFDPFTLAHQDLVERALPLFDKIYIAVGVNSAKQGLLTVEDKLYTIQAVFKDHPAIEIVSFEGLTINFCKKVGANFLLRGLRNSADFEFENSIAQNNLLLAPQIETYFLMSRSGLAHISSTIVRDVWKNKGSIAQMFRPK
ncbi:pantetheine-phosphate adenylyltransferase [Sphingobacterium sp. IITKGP-BTPF85]|uniref:pantetheine-phosphate adenylyltransferase n=1 Tax=Sphingobacterium sp. IITKGP-BTPF85 TaxID=1338009 RepID=UPI00038A27D6|nr:pantetheine-phosphate adenylyltransferase [Sphingobacterium sp. IITKGP-BTPF85]KKX50532.1 phosphopantetheine adenylyltransferase [Sphingobacterium sp. IITKGP-BTPF85]